MSTALYIDVDALLEESFLHGNIRGIKGDLSRPQVLVCAWGATLVRKRAVLLAFKLSCAHHPTTMYLACSEQK